MVERARRESQNEILMMEDQIARLEEQIAFQEDIIQKLDDALADQQKQLLTAEKRIELIMGQLRKLEVNQTTYSNDEIPPHY